MIKTTFLKKLFFLLGLMTLISCGSKTEDVLIQKDNQASIELQKEDKVDSQIEGLIQSEEDKLEDKMIFDNPGDDEIGEELKKIDQLINETSPSDYQSDFLDEENIELEIE